MTKLRTHRFTIRAYGISLEQLERLFSESDATIGFQGGVFRICFDRKAMTIGEAIGKAIDDVICTGARIKVVEDILQ